MFGYIGYLLTGVLGFFKKFIKSPAATLIYGIISKWYLLAMGLIVVVIYLVLDGLQKAGVLTKMESIFVEASSEIKGFAKYCVPKINNLDAFIACTQNTPRYSNSDQQSEVKLIGIDIQAEIEKAQSAPVDTSRTDEIISPYREMVEKEDASASVVGESDGGSSTDETATSSNDENDSKA